jgi:hypothetical protein
MARPHILLSGITPITTLIDTLYTDDLRPLAQLARDIARRYDECGDPEYATVLLDLVAHLEH